MNNEFLLVSDIHLEKKGELSQNFILNTINEKLSAYHNKKEYPTVVCAGDIHNGIKGLEWLSKINAKVVYLCGNHEFWEGDYTEVIKGIKDNLPENVYFLHNDFVIIEDNIFLGGTLWSDLGESLNPDILPHARGTMNDMYYITHKEWYDNPDNITSLKQLYSSPMSNIEDIINKKLWNVLIEKEENKKTINFFKNFIEVYEVLSKIPEGFSSLEYSLNTKYEYSKIDLPTYENKKSELESYLVNSNYGDWLEANGKLLRIDGSYLMEYNEEKESIFNRIKHLDLEKVKLNIVSHHLPFLEERLIGRQEWFDEKITKNYFNDLPDSIYSLRSGSDYPYPNYFWRLSKGEMSKDENIPQVVHYCNDGSANMPRLLLEKAHCWVHGHEHHYNYEDMLKGIKIATNPLAHTAVFTFEDNKIGINEHYMSYHKVKDEEAEIKKLKDVFLRKVNTKLSKAEMGEAATLWALKNFSWDTYTDLFNYTEKLNKKLLMMLLKHPKWSMEMTETESMNIKMLIDAIDLSVGKLENMEKRLNEGVAMRKLQSYSFNQKYGHSLELPTVEKHFKIIDAPLSKFNRSEQFRPSWDYSSWMHIAFKNSEYMELNKKELARAKAILQKFQFNRINEITPKLLKIFTKGFEGRKIVYNYELERALPEKLVKLRKQYQKEMYEKEQEEWRKKMDF